MNKQDWKKESKWESKWWDGAFNTYNEETKQYKYAHYMGLDEYATNWYGRRGWKLLGKGVMDIGGGPVSMLLKTQADRRLVLDPCEFPSWVGQRYQEAGIEYIDSFGEECDQYGNFDEVWIYNVLQHTISPQKILTNARKVSKIIRIFEWVDTPTTDGHPHTLKPDLLDEWLGGVGKVDNLSESPLVGKSYYGIFKGEL